VTPYQRGAQFERTVISALRRRGWNTLRVAGSKGAVDVVAWKLGQAVALQCRRNGRAAPSERVAMVREMAGLVRDAYVVRVSRRHLQVRSLRRWSAGWRSLEEAL
jgi:Holliday junction resolvase